jgi:RNA polymerase sigma factor (sigma-70 family)
MFSRSAVIAQTGNQNVNADKEGSPPSAIPTTRWGVAPDAATIEPAQAAAALEELCARYWYPVYAFVRQRGNDVHTAEDLTQGFFAFVLERHAFDRANRDQGRFRSFVLACLHHYLLNEHDRSQALKRGGGRKFVSLDDQPAEEIYRLETINHAPPEEHFERRWANILMQRAVKQLRSEYVQRGKPALFNGLLPSLTGELDDSAHQQVAAQLKMSPGAVKVALHRARRRFGLLLRREVAHTVSRPEDVEPELRLLLAAIAE